jgi:hypothetical protein
MQHPATGGYCASQYLQNNWLSALLSESFASSDKAKFWNYKKTQM